MRYLIILILLLPVFLLTGCGMIFKPAIDKVATNIFNVLIPDSCDIALLNDIADFRRNNNKFPSNAQIMQKIQTLSKECESNYDSINLFSFGADSAVLFIIKEYVIGDSKHILKHYRMRFENDTLVIRQPTVTLDSPDQGAKGIPAGPVVVQDQKVIIKAPDINGQYEGTVMTDSTITGTWSQNEGTLPLDIKKEKTLSNNASSPVRGDIMVDS